MEDSHLNKRQWERKMLSLLLIVLQKSVITKILPIVMVYTSQKYEGLSIFLPWYN